MFIIIAITLKSQSDTCILVPNKGIGNIILDCSSDYDIIAKYGKTKLKKLKGWESDKSWELKYNDIGLRFWLIGKSRKNLQVAWITITFPSNCTLVNGLKIGSTKNEVLELLDAPDSILSMPKFDIYSYYKESLSICISTTSADKDQIIEITLK